MVRFNRGIQPGRARRTFSADSTVRPSLTAMIVVIRQGTAQGDAVCVRIVAGGSVYAARLAHA